MTTPLPLPDDPRVKRFYDDWESGEYSFCRFPRSVWLGDMERVLREHYPQSSSKQRTLTARLAAPFPLAKPGVP